MLIGGWTKIKYIPKDDISKSSMFITIENTNYWRIVYHKDTKVMYAVSQSGSDYNESGVFTLLVDEDGKPMLYKK